MLRLVKTIHAIFVTHPRKEAWQLLWVYFRLLVRNRLAKNSLNEKMLDYKVSFPHRSIFFGLFNELFLNELYGTKKSNEELVIIDCGANIGMSMLYFKWRFPNASVVCIEPNPESIEYLKKNIEQNNLSNVSILPFALGSEEGKLPFYVDTNVKASSGASLTKQIVLKSKQISEINVDIKRLSQCITGPIDLLKVDVEGSEGAVFEDLEKEQKLSHIKQIYLEYHFDGVHMKYPLSKLLSLFDRNGFRYVINSPLTFPLQKHTSTMCLYIIYAWKV
jgi:FkbM family methyltransferase